ncbi:MAG: nucleoside phosphorylase [Chloroflexi bacterium]|nr:MAG: nucleoside phosphorylase [Chloroflexota bacterium]
MASPPACGLRGTSSITRCGGRRTCSLESTKAESPGRISIRPMAVTEKKYHVGLGPGDVGEYVLVPGDPFRTPLIAKHLDDSREVAFSREYRTFTGKVDGVPVSTMSTGMGGPSVAIGVEELHELGVHTLLRVGTCGASQPEIKMGDLVISYAAVRSEGTPNGYIPLEYPAVASLDVVEALVEAAEAAGAKYHVGVTRSVDALYSDLMPDQMPRPHIRDELEMWAKAGILSNDMEASTLFVVARLRKMRAGCVNLCVDELGAGEIHHLDPSYMDSMLKVAVDAIRRLIKRDARATQRQ